MTSGRPAGLATVLAFALAQGSRAVVIRDQAGFRVDRLTTACRRRSRIRFQTTPARRQQRHRDIAVTVLGLRWRACRRRESQHDRVRCDFRQNDCAGGPVFDRKPIAGIPTIQKDTSEHALRPTRCAKVSDESQMRGRYRCDEHEPPCLPSRD